MDMAPPTTRAITMEKVIIKYFIALNSGFRAPARLVHRTRRPKRSLSTGRVGTRSWVCPAYWPEYALGICTAAPKNHSAGLPAELSAGLPFRAVKPAAGRPSDLGTPGP